MLHISEEYAGENFLAELMQSLNVGLLGGLVFDLCTERDDRSLKRALESLFEGGPIPLQFVMDASQEAVAIHCFLPPILS